MAKALRKTLPKDLRKQMLAAAESGDHSAVHAALERCNPDARDGGRTPLMMAACTQELAAWLVTWGVDIDAADTWGYSALHHSARQNYSQRLPPETLLALGANVHATAKNGATPLHSAADGKSLHAIDVLLRHGAVIDAQTEDGLTPLEYALQRMQNIDFVDMVPVARRLKEAGARSSDKATDFVRQAAARFEFHRAAFKADLVEAFSAASAALCALFDVTPPERRRVHDGVSPIVAQAATWQDQHQELWELLVPAAGACKTIQGEVIRIAGRVSDELYRNGGGNWDSQYRLMLRAMVGHLSSHVALDSNDLRRLDEAVGRLPEDLDASRTLAELAVRWVARNPTPVALVPPTYKR